ncbi:MULTISPECIES: phosphoglucosamine mutase [Haloferax]|uniref:phosphoglucosamine mutase n=1 Tax=Haloferax TaxID=2251 RepID=UPI000E262F3C|nr:MULTISPECIES: phosphoglucosamine mutase [Haloferax]RDZ35278.1 phosphoglucosamine mutase [Haloferax sp. Atlit-24N]RLM35689.1 phosphoglucosamine mutase [Haloferax sp. Atlit-109R]RLM43537.1 phosphoglucosamine mutase [Haloferax sp. Atlit-105R]WEL26809.1 Phosphoglucosamine mutase [Haloferax lucentense]
MFGTSGVRGRFGDTITPEFAASLGHALAACNYGRIVIGRDARTTSPLLADAASSALRGAGVDVIRAGRVATPTLARGVSVTDADAGLMVTASHNPPADNGFKLWSPSGQAFNESRRDAVEGALEAGDEITASWDSVGNETTAPDLTSSHVNNLCDAVDIDGDVSVVVDIGNGMGGTTVDALLEMGCDVQTLNATPDGRFPGRPSEPTAETCSTLCSVVEATDADLGIAHDGDADRMMAVDETGSFVEGDELLALFGREVVADGERVAAPLNTSLLVDDMLASQGASLTRTKVGDVFVAEATQDDGVVFGGEPSGAWIWPDETLCPDGPLAACKLVELVEQHGSLATQRSELSSYPLRRTSLEVDNKRDIMDAVRSLLLEQYETTAVSTLDGVRVEHDDGWFLIRASGTQPLIRLTAEARADEQADALLETARGVVEGAEDR